jgi:putative DNA primase/helicase
MEYIVQAVDELVRIAKTRKLDLAQRNGDFYVYNGQYLERIQPESFHVFLRNATRRLGIPKDKSRWHKFQEKVRNQFKDTAHFPFLPSDGTIRINLKSGTLEFKEGQEPVLVSFDKRHGLTYQLGYDFDPAADCPKYQTFLDRCIPDAANQLILEEYAAYIFVRRLRFEKILFLYGGGANGKSTWLAVLTALLGKVNVTEYSLESITKKQEYRARLADGLLNVCTEAADNLNVDVFKKIASGEPLECRRLYENPMTLTEYSRQIFATNVLPKNTESTEGFFRRFLLIPFNQFIPYEDRNHAMNTVEYWQESGELPGILNRVISGLQRLLRNGGFTQSETADALLADYRRDSDSVALFVQNEGYKPDSVEKMLLKELYTNYQEYCQTQGYRAVSNTTLAQRLRNLGYYVAVGHGNKTFVYIIKTIII